MESRENQICQGAYSSVANGLTLCTFSTMTCLSASEVAAANFVRSFFSFLRRVRRRANSRDRSIRPIVPVYHYLSIRMNLFRTNSETRGPVRVSIERPLVNGLCKAFACSTSRRRDENTDFMNSQDLSQSSSSHRPTTIDDKALTGRHCCSSGEVNHGVGAIVRC